jgi:hypothetical protein
VNDLDVRLAGWNPVPDEDVANAADSSEAARLLTVTLRQPAPGARRRMSARRRISLRTGIAVVAAAVAVVAAIGLWPSGAHPRPGRGATPGLHLIAFSAGHGTITARITDPYAAASQLTAVMRAHGLDIRIQAVPVSPSLVGTIVYTDAPIIHTLWKPACRVTGCPVGLVIPASFTGQATIAVGRPARHGEMYESMADAFAPGEVLHCSGLQGAPVAAALPVLRKLGLTASWWAVSDPNWPGNPPPKDDQGPRPERPTGYIVDGTPVSATRVSLDTMPKLPGNRQFRQLVAGYSQGCH